VLKVYCKTTLEDDYPADKFSILNIDAEETEVHKHYVVTRIVPPEFRKEGSKPLVVVEELDVTRVYKERKR